MGKQGPCYHCGVSSTPLWRNGPPEKPVLCNACGSRWRTKGTLVNYTPIHARPDPDDYEDHRVVRLKSMSLKREEKTNKRKLNDEATMNGACTLDYNPGFHKDLYEDASIRSSSGSAISNPESCVQFGSADASELTGPSQSIVWDALVPSKKRTCVIRQKQSSVEKLTKDLYTILHEQASHFSDSPDDDLLFGSEAPMVSVEIGHGSVLIKHPSYMAREEESEASSLSFDYKFCKTEEHYSNTASLLSHKDTKSVKQLEQINRDRSNHEKSQTLWSHNSPLCLVDLTDIVNDKNFWGHLTADERQSLLKYLPSVDTSESSESLISLFSNVYFKESLASFKQLLEEGVLETSFLGVEIEGYKILQSLALSDLSKCKWVEYYKNLKGQMGNESTTEDVNVFEDKFSSSCNMMNAKKLRESQNHLFRDPRTTMRSPKRLAVKSGYETNKSSRIEGAFVTPRNLFGSKIDGDHPHMPDSFRVKNKNKISDEDLLLNIPSNGSFPQAELLLPSSSFSSQKASASGSSIHQTHIER